MVMMKQKVTTEIFDMGGTLEDIYTDDALTDEAVCGVIRILRKYGFMGNADFEEWKRKLMCGWERYKRFQRQTDMELKPTQIWRDYVLEDIEAGEGGFPVCRSERVCEELAHMWEVTYYNRSLRNGVPELLEELSRLHLKLGIISNTPSLYQVFDILEEYGVREYFGDVTLSSVTGVRKPAADIFKISLKQLCSKASECVYVGDTLSRDVAGARRAGFRAAIQIASRMTETEDESTGCKYKPDYVINDIGQVRMIIRKLNGLED